MRVGGPTSHDVIDELQAEQPMSLCSFRACSVKSILELESKVKVSTHIARAALQVVWKCLKAFWVFCVGTPKEGMKYLQEVNAVYFEEEEETEEEESWEDEEEGW
jgi:hypothetical protein